MQKKSHRARRIAQAIQQQLVYVLTHSVRDLRYKNINITDVVMSSDYRHADIYYTLLSEDELENVQKALDKAVPFLRTAVAGRVELRCMPSLHFHYDEAIIRGERLSYLIEAARLEFSSEGPSSSSALDTSSPSDSEAPSSAGVPPELSPLKKTENDAPPEA